MGQRAAMAAAPQDTASISFRENIISLIFRECLEILPPVDDGRGIDLFDTFENSGLQFIEGLNSYMAQKASSHLAEESLDDVQP